MPIFLSGVRRYFSEHLTKDEKRTVINAMDKVIHALGYEPEPYDQTDA